MFLSTKHQFSKGVLNSPSPFALEVGYLIVGGGGNGGTGVSDPFAGIISGGGGGGGGQVLIGYVTLARNTTYTVTVADVGSNASRGQSGVAGILALNGGNGGGAPPSSYNGQDVYFGPAPAAGGGGGGFSAFYSGFPSASGSPGNAFAYALGGTFGSSSYRCGGGGGAGSVLGFVSGAQEPGPGNGGNPTAGYGARPVKISLANTNFTLSAGGGGATLYQSNSRGFGGVNYIGATPTQYGGDGGYFTTLAFPQSASVRVNGQNAQIPNSGSGGGGSAGVGATPGYGAAGKVFIFYPGSPRATVTGTLVSTNTFAGITSHSFNSNGTISLSS